MELFLGWVAGVITVCLLIAIDLIFKRKVHRAGIVERLTRESQGKGEITIPVSDEVQAWKDRLKMNDLLGKDTPLKDL